MKTLYQFAESILLAYYGGERVDDSKFTIRQVAVWALQERDGLIKQDLFDQMKGYNNSPSPDFFKPYDLVAKWDTTRGELYLELPSKPASLPHDKGIGSVYPQGDPASALIRLPRNGYSLASQIHLEGNYLWELITDRKLELRDLPRTWEGKTFTVDMIPIDESPETSLSEPIRMPGEYEAIVRDRVLALMSKKQVMDTVNDDLDQT